MNYHLISKGKVRELYSIEGTESEILIITTDRVSVYNEVLPFTISGKGESLTRLTKYWGKHFREFGDCAILSYELEHTNTCRYKRLAMLGQEFIVRDYLTPRRAREMVQHSSIDGVHFSEKLIENDGMARFKQPVLSYYVKHKSYDQAISQEQSAALCGTSLIKNLHSTLIEFFKSASRKLRSLGLLLMDSKFELGSFGNKLYLADEILTPDSSRIIDMKDGKHLDKEYIRSYYQKIDTSRYDSHIPPEAVLKEYQLRYRELENRVIG
jgi:phosphoribosylaminoimidazole-succinocarboxamide synthase